MERSAESDTAPQCDEEAKADEDTTRPSAGKDEPVKEHDLQAQVCVCDTNECFCQKLLAIIHWHTLSAIPAFS